MGYTIPQPGDNRNHLKRKIPPGDAASVTADQSRPNKFRIMLRLPPRTPIPPRPRPLPPPRYHDDDRESTSDEDTSTSGPTESSEEDEEEDDEDMIDDFNTLLADGIPISIPCTRTGSPPRQSAFAPFFDSCEPPPDSEDEDDDFHNSMLRGESAVENEDDTIKQELPDFTTIKEEEIVAIVLNELATPEPIITSTSQLQVKLEDALYSMPLMTARPELEWTGLETENGVFSPMDTLGADSPASVDIDDNATRLPSPALFSSSSYPSFSSIHSEHSHAVPPPSPWIKTEEEQPLFIDRASPEGEASIIDEFDINPVPSPAIPIPSKKPVADDSISLVGPESVSTDDVDILWGGDFKQCTTSTSAPSHSSSHRRGRPYAPRLSVGGLAAFNTMTGNSGTIRPGHARRHSHAVSTTSHRRLSIISSAFSDWTSGTPEDSSAPLATPSHTGWAFQWPISNGGNDSNTPLAEVKMEEKPIAEEILTKEPEEVKPPKREIPLQAANTDDDLNRCLMAPSFNQCLNNKALPPNTRISTLLLLGKPKKYSLCLFIGLCNYLQASLSSNIELIILEWTSLEGWTQTL